MNKYEQAFKERNLRYKLILLKPNYKNVVERCQTRTCHTSITPEKWIKYYYDALDFDSHFFIVDNTNMSVQDTVEYILEIWTNPMQSKLIIMYDFAIALYLEENNQKTVDIHFHYVYTEW